MKKILISLSIIGVVAAIVVGGTVAYFGDTETSTGNTFTAGTIDLKIDLQCEGNGCGFPLKDLVGDTFFNECDLKPGDTGEVTVSMHVYDNNAWAGIKVADATSYEYGCTEPEEEAGDPDCGIPGDGEGELDEYLEFNVWLDEGSVPGWQCGENNPACAEDPNEGDNELDGEEELIADGIPLSELIDEWFIYPDEMVGSTTYYIGIQWVIPFETGNIIQSDSLVGKIIFRTVQSRNNPDKEGF